MIARSAPKLSTFAIAATYVGTVVGAGFATGQEVFRFFSHYGAVGTWGLALATAGFAYFGMLTLRLGAATGARSHVEVIRAALGPRIGALVDSVVTFFLFAGLAVMLAGSGAVFYEHWHLSRLLGTVVMAVLTVGTVLLGLRGVVASISAVAPVLLVSVLAISLGTVLQAGPGRVAWYRPDLAAAPVWPLAALLYVSYNLILATAVLAPLGAQAGEGAVLRRGGFWGGVALGVGALAIHLALVAGLPESAAFEVPMLHLARRFPAWVQMGYSLVLWAEVFTTAVSSLYGLVARLTRPEVKQHRLWVVGLTAMAWLTSQMGFSTMVAVIYPLVGYAGLLLLGGLARWGLRRGAAVR